VDVKTAVEKVGAIVSHALELGAEHPDVLSDVIAIVQAIAASGKPAARK